MKTTTRRRASRGAAFGLLAGSAALGALAQSAQPTPAMPAASAESGSAPQLQSVTITGSSSLNSAGIAGFGDMPLSRTPLSATVISVRQLQDAGIAGLGDLTRLDAGATDAYNPPGYWSQLAVRGFIVDNRFNYRRDGLPINAESIIGLANKQALELLKGTSGLQAGTSAPGGLVNLVVKRPVNRVRDARLAFEQDGSLGAGIDIGERNDAAQRFGWRLNLDAERLDPRMQSSRGERWLAAGAVEMQLTERTLVEAEVELSRHSQPSTPGFSLLGNRLPSARDIDPTLNLNNQSWSLPVVFGGRTGSLRVTHALGDELNLVAHLMRQSLRTDDRIAFPFGCSAENDYSRYCSDGSFDLYDFRSEGERRTSDAFDLSLGGRAQTGAITHRFKTGVLLSRYKARFNQQAYNLVGIGNIDGSLQLPSDPSLTDENTNRSERSTEFYLQDAIELDKQWSLWAGLRHSRLQRDSVRTDGSRPTGYSQSVTTPWLALAYAPTPRDMIYASWGQGIESEVAPNRTRYSNAGRALPALKSRQFEIGFKHSGDALDWRLAAFDIARPAWSDIHTASGIASQGDCSDADPCTRRADGRASHRGIEADAEWRSGAWSLRGSALLLRARRSGATDPNLDGKRPTNVPARSLKLQAAYNVPAVPGLALLGFVTYESSRMVLPDNSIETPGWTRIDLGTRYTQQLDGGQRIVWRLGIDNIADRRAWKETPFQYDHAYLYPLAPRTVRASAQISF